MNLMQAIDAALRRRKAARVLEVVAGDYADRQNRIAQMIRSPETAAAVDEVLLVLDQNPRLVTQVTEVVGQVKPLLQQLGCRILPRLQAAVVGCSSDLDENAKTKIVEIIAET